MMFARANVAVSLMMSLALMMSASPNVFGRHRIIARKASSIIMQSIPSYRYSDAS